MNWNKINLKDGYERGLYMLDPYSSDALLLEINCSLPVINTDTVRKQFEESLQAKITKAHLIFEANIDNFVKYSNKVRKACTGVK